MNQGSDTPLRLLVTGSRAWVDRDAMVRALSEELKNLNQGNRPAVLVHGAAKGADQLAARIWLGWHHAWPRLYLPPEAHPASKHEDPKARNLHMVSLGADRVIVFAQDWASGAGHCARAARRAGLRVVDYGVSTKAADNPNATLMFGEAA